MLAEVLEAVLAKAVEVDHYTLVGRKSQVLPGSKFALDLPSIAGSVGLARFATALEEILTAAGSDPVQMLAPQELGDSKLALIVVVRSAAGVAEIREGEGLALVRSGFQEAKGPKSVLDPSPHVAGPVVLVCSNLS